jgi:CheY-like chemotaxis protein
LHEIRRAAERAALLTRQLLLFGRKGVWEDRFVNVNELVTGSSRMLRRLLGEDVLITMHARAAVAGTRGDPAQLEQVVLNLALNARDAMPNGGTLAIETDTVQLTDRDGDLDPEARPGQYVALRVTDTGSGMSPEVRAHLFEPFFTTKGPGKGTGLGLSTVYGIVRQAAGFITVDTAPGTGSTFTVYLPATAEKPDSPPSVTPRERGATGSETILVVEDEASVRGVTVRSLESHGFRVLDVGTSAEALALIEGDVGRQIALLLTDVVMPVMGGGELATRARIIRPDLPVIFMSGYSPEQATRQGLLSTGDRLLQKPFTAVSLTTAVRDVIDARGG